MAHWTMTNNRTVGGYYICDLNHDGVPVLTGVPYNEAFDHVLDNGADADTYQEQHMSKPQTVAELRTERDAQDRWFAQH